MTDFSFFHLLFCCDTFLEVVLYFFFSSLIYLSFDTVSALQSFSSLTRVQQTRQRNSIDLNYHSLWFHSNFSQNLRSEKKWKKTKKERSFFFVMRYGRCRYSFPEVRIYILQFPKVGLWEVEQKSYPNNTFKPWRSFIFYSDGKMARGYFFKAMKEKLIFICTRALGNCCQEQEEITVAPGKGRCTRMGAGSWRQFFYPHRIAIVTCDACATKILVAKQRGLGQISVISKLPLHPLPSSRSITVKVMYLTLTIELPSENQQILSFFFPPFSSSGH